MKLLTILTLCCLTSSCFANFSFLDLSMRNQRRIIVATKICAAMCTVLSAYNLTSGVLQIALLSPLRGMGSVGWGGISLCTAYTLYQWSSNWQKQHNAFHDMTKN